MGLAALGPPYGIQPSLQHLPCKRRLFLRHFLRRAGDDDPAAAYAAFRAEVDDPIGRLDDFGVVLDDQYRVARLDEIVQHLQEQLDVGEVQPGRWLVQQIKRAAGAFLHEFASELDSLRLAAGKRRRRLAEFDVIETHFVQRAKLVGHGGDVLEMGQRLLHVHLQHFGDRLAFEADLQRLAVEAMAFAHRASDPDIGEKIHFQLRRAVALARLATAAADVEAEAARLKTLRLGLGKLRVKAADFVENLDVGGRVRAGRAADGRLVDGDDLVEVFEALDLVVFARIAEARVEIAVQGLDDDVVHERALAGAGNARHADEDAERDFDVDVFEVIVPRAADDEPPVAVALAASGRHFDPPAAAKKSPGDAFLVGSNVRKRAFGDDVAAADAGSGTEVDDMIGRPHRVLVVLNDDHRVAQVAKLSERFQQLVVIARMQADGRLIENVEHADKSATDLPCQADALHLAAGERRRGAVEREVLQPDVFEKLQPAADFLEGLGGDRCGRGIEFQSRKELGCIAHG